MNSDISTRWEFSKLTSEQQNHLLVTKQFGYYFLTDIFYTLGEYQQLLIIQKQRVCDETFLASEWQWIHAEVRAKLVKCKQLSRLFWDTHWSFLSYDTLTEMILRQKVIDSDWVENHWDRINTFYQKDILKKLRNPFIENLWDDSDYLHLRDYIVGLKTLSWVFIKAKWFEMTNYQKRQIVSNSDYVLGLPKEELLGFLVSTDEETRQLAKMSLNFEV